MGLNLRPYQEATLDALRKGFLEGNKCQILYAPTGAGKTEMAIALLEATRVKGNRAAMILDRIVLCDQTSQRLEKYSIEHGVLQSGHWRYRPDELIQVCSAQTLERRGEFPGLNLLIIDECHQTRQQTIQFIKDNPKVHVVGLTATPFTQGLAHTYKSVVSTVTTKDLVNQEVLVPLRVFIAKEINMVGAKKVAGEWSVADVTRRGKKITGDIVNEWVKKTFEVFGKPSKTIVFCSGVAHGTDLARSFQEQGYNFINISYQDDDKFKAEVIEDFSKPDTEIVGLIATDILTKGFDVPDVMIGVSARPFSKSLSSHIQQMGRVMRGCKGKDFALWLCLAKGSRVLTDRGLVAIDKVTLAHKIWDGTNFVTHKGAVCNGIQKTITYQGLTATAGHLVHTSKGWRTFGECAREQIRITQTGFDGQTIRIGDDLRSTSFLVGRTAKKIYSCFVRMCDCGYRNLISLSNLQSGKTKGCRTCNQPEPVYPMWLYNRVQAMRARCCSQSNEQYPAYGGKGVEFRFSGVKEGTLWIMNHIGIPDFSNIAERSRIQIDRINPSGHYEPGNLRWLSVELNQQNKRGNQAVARTHKFRLNYPDIRYSDSTLKRFFWAGMTDVQIIERYHKPSMKPKGKYGTYLMPDSTIASLVRDC